MALQTVSNYSLPLHVETLEQFVLKFKSSDWTLKKLTSFNSI